MFRTKLTLHNLYSTVFMLHTCWLTSCISILIMYYRDNLRAATAPMLLQFRLSHDMSDWFTDKFIQLFAACWWRHDDTRGSKRTHDLVSIQLVRKKRIVFKQTAARFHQPLRWSQFNLLPMLSRTTPCCSPESHPSSQFTPTHKVHFVIF